METNAARRVAPPDPAPETEEKSRPAAPGASVVPIEVSPPQMVAVRRRSRRRRSRRDKNDTPQRKAYVLLLCVVFALMTMAIIRPVREAIYQFLHSLSPALAGAGIGFEAVALVLAGLILLYLMPGMEERILRLFGINRPKR